MSRRRIIIAVGAATAVALTALYMFVEPSSGLYPRCPFKMLTGQSCPGCGTQRALHALFSGNPGEALRYNAALIPFILLALLYGAVELMPRRFPGLRRRLMSRTAAFAVAGALAGWWLLRNLFAI